MNRYFIAAMLMAVGCANVGFAVDSTGANDTFYVESNEVLIDPNTNLGTIRFCLDNETTDYNSFQFDLYLPEGFYIEKNARGAYKLTLNKGEGDDDKMYDHNVQAGYLDDENPPYYRIFATSITFSTILANNDWILDVQIHAPEGWCTPPLRHEDGKVTDAMFFAGAEPAITHSMSDLTFDITPNPGIVGIEDVEADAAGKDVIYDIHGRRVEGTLAPGVYIINGEKTAIR